MSMPFRNSLIALAAALGATLAAAPAEAQAPKSAPPSPALRKEFDGFIARFRAALKADDAAAIAALTRLPFMNDPAASDAAQFRATIYAKRIGKKTRDCIQRGKPIHDRDGQGTDKFMIFCGQSIFTFEKTPTGFLFTDIDAND